MSDHLRLGEKPGRAFPWVKKRTPQEMPIRASLYRIYAMPHRSGIVWSVIVLVILVWSVNSTDNMGLLLGSLLGAAGIYGALMPCGRLMGLRLISATVEPIYEGSTAQLRMKFRSRRNPDGLIVESGVHFEPVLFDSSGVGEASLSFTTEKRGVYAWPLLRVSTRRPFGISVSWVKMWPSGEIVVWPQPESMGPACPGQVGQHQKEQTALKNRASSQAEEWSSLKEYRPGDRLRDMDWKRVARTGSYWVKQYDAPPGGQVDIRWNDTNGLPHEARIRRMARWVVESERQGRSSSLSIPFQEVPAGRGPSHRAACLTALARMPHE